jgi:hypothetical protein
MNGLAKALQEIGAGKMDLEKIDFGDLNIMDIGASIQLVGIVLQGKGTSYLCPFPAEAIEGQPIQLVSISQKQWDDLIRQTDIMETEIIQKMPDGKLAKIILRKSNRQIEQGISWRVYKRDGYRCRYCGNDDVPLSVDHAPLPYEECGPSTEDNLVAACRKCNREKSNMSYEDWLSSKYYQKVSQGLSEETLELNRSLLGRIDSIKRVNHIKSR